MKGTRQTVLGVLTALFSICVVLGSFSVALTEGGIPQAMLMTSTNTPLKIFQTLASTSQPTTREPHTPTAPASGLNSQSPQPLQPTQTPVPSQTPSPTIELQVNCPPMPPGWIVITVEPGDTLASLAMKYNTTPELLMQVNCMILETILPGSRLRVPAITQPTQTVVKCGPPPGWVFYTVRIGDTLYHIGQLFGVTVDMLKFANCLTSDLIRVGQRLYVPNVPIRTATAPVTSIPSKTWTPSPPPTSTATPVTPSSTPTNPQLPPTSTPTQTQVPLLTATNTVTNPPPATATTTPTSVAPSTNTSTPTTIQTATSTVTFTPTATPSPTPTASASSTATATPTLTFTPTETFTVQPSSTNTATSTATETKTSY